MKNLKKVLSVLIVVAMIATTMVPAFAAETATISADAKICADLGMLVGDGSGVTADYTKTNPTRIQAAVMLLRLKGLAADAAKFTGKDNFADVKGDEWFAPYTAYLKANAKVGFVGGDDGKFAADEKITAQQYYKVMLTALGYECAEGKDYKYEDTIKFAETKGLKLVAKATTFTVDNVATATVEALKGTVKGGTKTLVTTLVDAKVLDAAKVTAAFATAPAGAMTVKAVGAKKFEIAFNKAVDASKIKVTAKKGASTYNSEAIKASDDKKSIVATMTNPFTAGEYEVSVTGVDEKALTAKITTEAEKVAKIEFLSESAVLVDEDDYGTVSVSFKVLNQYNEDITTKKWSGIDFNSSGDCNASNGKVEITLKNDKDFTIGEKITVSANYVDTDNYTNIYASQIFTVARVASVAEIKIVELYNADKNELNVEASYSDFKLIVEAKDQYGVEIPYGSLASGLIIQSTNTNIVDVADKFEQLTINGEKVTALALKEPEDDDNDGYDAGTANIMFVSRSLPATASYTITVKDTKQVDTLSIQSPDFPIAGEKVVVPFTAVDADGKDVTDVEALNDLDLDVSDSDCDVYFELNAETGKPQLILDATAVDDNETVYITGTTDTYKAIYFGVSLQDPAEIESITGIASGFYTNILEGDVGTFDYYDATLVDTYGRTVSRADALVDFNFGTDYRLYATTSNKDKVSFSVVDTVTDNVYGTYINYSKDALLSAVAKGSSTITLTLQKYDTEDKVWEDISDYTFTATAVTKEDIKSYTASAVTSFYSDVDKMEALSHDVQVKVEGVLANGKKVYIPYTFNGITNKADLTYDQISSLIPTNYKVTTSSNLRNWQDYDTNTVRTMVYSADTSVKDGDDDETAYYTVTVFGYDQTPSIINTTKVTGDNVEAAKIVLYETYDGIGRYNKVTGTSKHELIESYVKDSATVANVSLTEVYDAASAIFAAARAIKITDQYAMAYPVAWNDDATKVSISASALKDQDGNVVTDRTTYKEGDQITITVIADSQILTFTFKITEANDKYTK